jgi:TP901 family phage tail tape measure protein
VINETITIDAGPAIGELDALAGAAEGAAAKIDAAFKSIKVPTLGGSGAGNMARSMDAAAAKMEAAVGKMEASFAKLKAVGAEAGAAMGDIGKAGAESAAGLGDAAKGANDAAASYARLGKASRDSAAMMEEQAVASKRAAKTTAEGAAASQGFFSKHKELILGTGLALGYAVDKAMKFDASMTLLNTQAGVSVKQMPQLTKGVLELAGQVGQSPGNLAESLYHVESNMSSLGIKAPQALHMVKVAAEGASVGHANLVDTTNALTAAVASGIPGVKSYDQAMGVLNSTVGAGDMSMQDLADAMGTGALAAVKGYGANIKDAGAALATFGDNNIRGAVAGTDLRMAVQSLAVQSPSATKELKALGLSAGELGKNMQAHGMLSALDLLSTKFKEHGINAKNMGTEITDLFGKKAGVGLAILMEQMGRVQSKYPELTRGANDFGKAWDKTLQTPQQKLHNLVQGTQALAITAGNVLMPYANKALGGIDAGMQWLQSHALASKGLALGAGALVVGGITKGLFSGVESSLQGLGKLGSALKIPGLDKLANIGKGAGLDGAAAKVGGAGASLDGAAAALKGAAAELSGAAAELRGGGLGSTAGKAGGAAAGAEGAAAGAAGGEAAAGASRFKGPAITAGLGALAALTIADPILHSMKSGPGGRNWLDNPFGMPGPNDKGSANNWLTSFSPYERLFRQTAAPKAPPAVPADVTPGFAARFGGGASAPVVKPKIQPPDTSGIAGALAGLANSVKLKPVKMPAPDMSALNAAKGKATSAGNGITQAIEQAMHKPVKLPPPDLSAASAAAGKARGIGAGISAGLAAGILAGEGAVVAAATAVGNAAAAAMAHAAQTHSPSRKTKKTGQDMAKGLEIGLQGGQAAVDAAAAALGKNAAKATDIAAIDAASKKLLGEVPKGDTALTRMLKADTKDLERMANQRTKLEQEISDSEQAAKSAISGASIMNSLTAVNPAGAEPIASAAVVQGQQYQAASMKQFAQQLVKLQGMGLNATSLSQIAQAGPDQGLGIAQGITSGGKQAVTQLNQLQKQMQSSAAAIGNVAGPAMYQAGKDAGAGLAAGLKSELGSLDKAMEKLAKAMVSSVEKHTKTAKKATHKAAAGTASAAASSATSTASAASGGSTASAAGTGKDSLTGAAQALSAAGTGLSSAATALSAAAASLQKSAGGAGSGAGAGSAGGGHARVPVHAQPVAAHAGAGIRPGPPPRYEGGGSGSGGYGYLPFGGGQMAQHVHYHVNQNVQGSVHAMNDLVDAMQEGLLHKGIQNWQTGIIPPGRAG